MKSFLLKLKSWVFAHKKTAILLVIILSASVYGIFKIFNNSAQETRYVFASVERGTIVSSVSGTGQVSASNQIEIKPKISGDVIYIGVQSGQEVKAGALIAQIDAKDAQKSIRDAEINLESAKLSLEKLKLQNSNENMNANLTKAYDDGFNAVSDTFLDLPSTVTGLENLLNQNNLSENAARVSGKTAQDYRSTAETAYYDAKNAFDKNRIYYRTLNHNSPAKDIDKIINQTYETTKLIADAIKKLRNFVDFLSEDTGRTSEFTSYQNTLSTYTSTNNGHLDNLLTIKTNIRNYNDAFPNANLDLQSSELSVKQKENTLQDTKDKLADYYIRAPFEGAIAILNIKKSDSVSSSTVIGTLVTKQKIAEISLNEVDATKIKVGQKATLSFDAIEDLTITGEVIEVDLIGTVSQGVVSYIVKIGFDTGDDKVRPGMTVSANIITNMKQNVLIVPSSAVKTQGNTSYVEIVNEDLPLTQTSQTAGVLLPTLPIQVPVTLGLSSDESVEIVSGLTEGDKYVVRKITTVTTSQPISTSAPSLLGGGGVRTGGGNFPR
ncbi:MAG: HlyD family efflux transporter periplasmic adaptor subunit [Candidatus Pacebacteria bacterium]|nr:HlyD family efflux transporter periplasmic adaptor subunit [Candidatus Paceibacterota bacterium]